jgi:hypothetical protein
MRNGSRILFVDASRLRSRFDYHTLVSRNWFAKKFAAPKETLLRGGGVDLDHKLHSAAAFPLIFTRIFSYDQPRPDPFSSFPSCAWERGRQTELIRRQAQDDGLNCG